MKILTRKEIEEITGVIEALYYRDIKYMQHTPDEAIYDLGRVIDNKKLRRRAGHIMDMVELMPFESIHSRRLWQVKGFCQEVWDFLSKVDLEISKVDKLEREIEEIHQKALDGIDELKPKWDKRMKDINAAKKIKHQYPELRDMPLSEIIDRWKPNPDDDWKYYPPEFNNIDYTKMMKERRKK